MLAQLIMDHYLIDTLDRITGEPTTTHLPSVNRLREDLLDWAPPVEVRVLENLKDFVALSCIDELSYGRHCVGFRGVQVVAPRTISRESILSGALKIFREGAWEKGYGGPKWGVLAWSAFLEYTIPRVGINVLINACHNGGSIFNRSFRVLPFQLPKDSVGAGQITTLLDYLTSWGPLFLEPPEYPKGPLPITSEVYSFLKRALTLNLCDVNIECYTPSSDEYPSPLTWGDGRLEVEKYFNLTATEEDPDEEDREEAEDDEDETTDVCESDTCETCDTLNGKG